MARIRISDKNTTNVERNVQTGGVPKKSAPPFSSLRRLDIFLTFMVLLLVGIAAVQFFQIKNLSEVIEQNTPKVIVMDNETDISGLDFPVPVLPKESIK